MKALSIWQPWATLIIIGAKKIETRGRPTMLRSEDIAIHASKSLAGFDAVEAMPWKQRHYILDALRDAGYENMRELPLGAVLGIAELVACWHTEGLKSSSLLIPDDQKEREFAMGDFSDYRWGWYMRDPLRFEEPIPARGQQGLWDWKVPQCAYNTSGLGARLARKPDEVPVWVRR